VDLARRGDTRTGGARSWSFGYGGDRDVSLASLVPAWHGLQRPPIGCTLAVHYLQTAAYIPNSSLYKEESTCAPSKLRKHHLATACPSLPSAIRTAPSRSHLPGLNLRAALQVPRRPTREQTPRPSLRACRYPRRHDGGHQKLRLPSKRSSPRRPAKEHKVSAAPSLDLRDADTRPYLTPQSLT
jgi:hypothetical protein